jgi:hypothetical protein
LDYRLPRITAKAQPAKVMKRLRKTPAPEVKAAEPVIMATMMLRFGRNRRSSLET